MRRKTDIIDVTRSPISWLIPPFWLMQNKLWEVLLVSISVYLITLSVAWWMFAITWILLAIYFNKGQTTILRSFSIYRDNHFWLVLAGRDEEQIQQICRQLDPKCTFDYPLVPPLEEKLNKKQNEEQIDIIVYSYKSRHLQLKQYYYLLIFLVLIFFLISIFNALKGLKRSFYLFEKIFNYIFK